MTWIARYYSLKKTIVPMPLRIEAVVLAPRHRAEVLVLRRKQQKTLFSPEKENEVPRSSSEDDQSFARTAGTRSRRRFSQTTRAICSSVQIRRMEVRVQDVFADHDDTELDLR